MNYYDAIAQGYDELHKEEQLAKLAVIESEIEFSSQDTLLDVGCGTGFSLDYFAVSSAKGIDPAAKLVAQYTGSQDIQVGSAENLPFADGVFDIVISITAIQNFNDVKKGLEEIKRVGKNRFALTYLKHTTKDVDSILLSLFDGFSSKRIEQEHDIIWIFHQN